VIDWLYYVEVPLFAKEVLSAIGTTVMMRKRKYQVKQSLIGDELRNDL
jgi:hypothetical protein